MNMPPDDLSDPRWCGESTPSHVTAATLTALLGEPSPRERYRQVSGEAARLERDKQYRSARQAWLMAAKLAPLHADRAWCDARALWCGHLLAQSHYPGRIR